MACSSDMQATTLEILWKRKNLVLDEKLGMGWKVRKGRKREKETRQQRRTHVTSWQIRFGRVYHSHACSAGAICASGDEPPVRDSDRGAERLDIIDGLKKDLSICGEDTMLDQLAGEYRRAN